MCNITCTLAWYLYVFVASFCIECQQLSTYFVCQRTGELCISLHGWLYIATPCCTVALTFLPLHVHALRSWQHLAITRLFVYMWFSVCIQQYQVIFCMQLAYTMVIAGVATEVHYPDFCFLWWFNFISYRILLCSYFCILMFWWVRIFILVGSLIIHLSGMCPCVCWFFSNVCDGTPFNSNIAWSCTQAHRKTICRPNI